MKRSVFPFLLCLLFTLNSSAQTFSLKSNDLSGQITSKQVFNSFGCTGGNLSPQLYWENIPEGTRSFAVTMYDPDAPTGSGWWHWIVFDIPAEATELKQGAGDILKNILPKGSIQSSTDFGQPGYGGPCPPEGDRPHQYIFTVYALKTASLGLNKDATPAMVGFYLNANTIAKASIVAYFKR